MALSASTDWGHHFRGIENSIGSLTQNQGTAVSYALEVTYHFTGTSTLQAIATSTLFFKRERERERSHRIKS